MSKCESWTSRACTGNNLLRRFWLAGKGLNLCAIHLQKMSALSCSTSFSMGIAGEAENVAEQPGIDFSHTGTHRVEIPGAQMALTLQ